MAEPTPPTHVPGAVALLLVAALLGLGVVAQPARPPAPTSSPPPASEPDPLASALQASTAGASSDALPTAPLDEEWGDDRADPPGARAHGEWGDDWGEAPAYLVERVRGRVVDQQGLARSGVAVTLRQPAAGAPLAALATGDGVLGRDTTGPDGTFEVALTTGVAASSLGVTAHDLARGELAVAGVADREPGPDRCHDLGELRLEPAHRLDLVARGGGQPLAGASVTIDLRASGRSARVAGSTDANGALAVDLLACATELELVLAKEGRASVRRELGPLAGPLAVEVELPPGAVLWGRVVDATGRHASWASVTARPGAPGLVEARAEADADGRFVIGGLAHGVGYTVTARAITGDFAPADVEVALPSPELVLRLGVPGALLVTLVPPRTAEHVAPAWLSGVELELLRAGLAPGAWTPALWHEEEQRIPAEGSNDWGDDWGDGWSGPAPRAPSTRRLAADQRLLRGLTPGRYWIRARDPWSQAASAPVELLVSPGAEETVTLTLER